MHDGPGGRGCRRKLTSADSHSALVLAVLLVVVGTAGTVPAAIGEFIAHKDALRAGKVGAATWFGLLVGTAVKIAVAFTMIGVFVAAIFF